MDLYTTSFSYPHPPPRSIRTSASPLPTSLPLPGSNLIQGPTLPNVTTATTPAKKSSSAAPLTTHALLEKEWEEVQKLCLDITARQGCLVTATKEQLGYEQGLAPTSKPVGDNDLPIPHTTVWNFHLSGGYQSVMAARGAVLREVPRDNRTVIKVPRTDILDSPLSFTSSLKSEVKKKLDEIASESKARISVLNMEYPGSLGVGGTIIATANGDDFAPTAVGSSNGHTEKTSPTKKSAHGSNSSSINGPVDGKEPSTNGTRSVNAPASYGLETERMCELVLTGKIESVEIAKVRLLVMLDELSGLHSEVCDIDYKLHAIVAGRKRSVIQSIQEETATNIYFPTQLVGVLNAPQPGTQQGIGYRTMAMPMQPTGPIPMQMTGQSMHSMGGGMGMNGNMGMGMNHQHMPNMHMGNFHPHHQPPHRSTNSPPAYNPHQHVQYPYQPQPLDINPQTTRGLPYSGPGMQHYAMNGMSQAPMQVNHTGMSMQSSFQPSRIGSPIPISHLNSPMSGHMPMGGIGLNNGGVGQHGPHHGMTSPHHMGGPQGPQHIGGMPFPNGQGSHLHQGGGGGHMGMNNGGGPAINMPMGINMNGPHMGHGQFNPAPHPGLSIHSGEQGALGLANQIWITGEFFGVQRARDMLLNVAVQKSKLVISRDTAILPRKLDWLLSERIEEIKNIMNDNGTYMQVPSVGTQASLITVFGDHRVNIERTIRSIMGLACQFYIASFWLLPVSFDVLMPQASLNPAQMQPVLKQISHATGAEIVFKSNCFEMHGMEQEVRAAVMMILELEVVHNFHHEIRFQIELANEHREFISGKKNGKINKIMKMAGVKIKFETFNDYNFLMDISGNDLGSLQGLSMLQEELPAETSFHVPESYHKRIIGVGGKNIQRIMKLFGVYVKFSNAEEFAAIGGYLDNEDNVVARTPAKNAINLESLKQSVMELVNPKDKDYTVESVSIPRRYHRTLLGEKSIFIHDIEQKTNSTVRFPYKETASDIVTIFGPESQVHIAAAMLLDHVPFEADLHVPPNPELTRLVTSADFILFSERVKRDHQIAIAPSVKFGQGDEAVFKFRCQRSNIDFLGTARDVLEEWLGQHEVYPSTAHKRIDNFTDAFSHFNSKLLATGHGAGDGEGESLVQNRQRQSVAAPNVKALFDGPSPGGFRSSDDSGPGFAGPLGYPTSGRAPDFWQPAGAPAPVTIPSRSETDPSNKRDSDPIIQDKVRQAQVSQMHAHGPHGQARGVSARTQSLDITSLNFSRALASGSGQSAFAPIPPSPSPGGLSSSPNTATGQVFPQNNGSATSGSGSSLPGVLPPNVTGKGYYESQLDSATQGEGNFDDDQLRTS